MGFVGLVIEFALDSSGGAYRSTVHAIACRVIGIRHLRTRPYRPQTSGKAERFIRSMLSGWAYAATYRSSAERNAALAGGLDFYDRRRPHGALGHKPPIARLNALNNLLGSYTKETRRRQELQHKCAPKVCIERVPRPPTPAAVDFAERLRLSINRFVGSTRNLPGALTWAQSDTLSVLERHGPMTIAQLAAARRVKHRGMSRTVGDLETAGLVARAAAVDDARAVIIALTDHGDRQLGADREIRAAALEKILAERLDDHQRELLDAIPELLERLAGDDGSAP